jgi:NAD(P)-dependent dehydrogenase (short-subunit alcohol dehydrogenase family)
MGGAVVTGGGGGLGLAIAQGLAARGLTVHVTDVQEASASAAAVGIGRGAWASALDVRDESACRRAAAETAERAGSLDVWVNNAGILIPGLAYEQGLEALRAMLEVNAIGTYNGTIAALELMVPRRTGHVINIVSLAGLVAAPGEVGYAASKHAAMAFSIGVLTDLRRGGIRDVHVSAVCPDGIWSPMIEGKLDDLNAAPSFSGKMLMPEQVAEKVVGLLDRPRPVLTIPRWRGRLVRFFDRHPRLAIAMTPLAMRDAERRQQRFKKRIEAGKWPPRSRERE